MQRFPLNAIKISPIILLSIQQQANIHPNRHDGSHKQLDKDHSFLALSTINRPQIDKYLIILKHNPAEY